MSEGLGRTRGKAVLFALTAVFFWATWPVFAMITIPAPPFFVLAAAAWIGFAVSGVIFTLRGRFCDFLRTPLSTQFTVTVGLLGTNGFFLFAMPRIGAAEANVIAFLWPILLILIMSWFGGARLTGLQKAGVVAGFAGAALAIGPSFGKGFDPGGIFMAFLGGLSFAVYSAIRVRGREQYDVVGPSLGLLAIAATGLHLLTETRVPLEWCQWLAIVGIGIFSLNLSNGSWDRATRTGQLAIISSIAYLTPLVSLMLLAAFGVGLVTAFAIVGGILVVCGASMASVPTT